MHSNVGFLVYNQYNNKNTKEEENFQEMHVNHVFFFHPNQQGGMLVLGQDAGQLICKYNTSFPC